MAASTSSRLKTWCVHLHCCPSAVRPDMTFAVDWALNNNYLSCLVKSCLSSSSKQKMCDVSSRHQVLLRKFSVVSSTLHYSSRLKMRCVYFDCLSCYQVLWLLWNWLWNLKNVQSRRLLFFCQVAWSPQKGPVVSLSHHKKPGFVCVVFSWER